MNESRRYPAVDALRGLIMVLMAFDHANFFIAQKHSPGEYWGGPFPIYQDPIAFLARFITHPAAPGFSFLMGLGMALFARSRRSQGWSRWVISRHFLIRGTLLIFLQLFIVNRAWELAPQGWGLDLYFGVLIALGGGMIIGSLLVWLSPMNLLFLAVVFLFGTEWLTPGQAEWSSDFSLPVRLLLIPGGEGGWWVNYPILQWLELVLFGLVVGNWLADDTQKTYRGVLVTGLFFLLAFAVIRTLDGFGNLRPQVGQGWMAFFSPVKYPPSITFTLMTMGVNLVLLGVFGRVFYRYPSIQVFLQPLSVFGRAPLFFYLTHLFFYAGLGNWLTPQGTSIPAMTPIWLLGVLLLYPLCKWFGTLKRNQPGQSMMRYL